jgi:hypothetical protein
MNTGQLMLTIGGMFLLAMLVLRTNNTFLKTNEIMMNSKISVAALSLATSVVEEASGKQFDENTSGAISDSTQLTLPGNLNPEAGEVYPNFDDFDDYNNYSRTDTISNSAIYSIKCRVVYVQFNNTTKRIDEITNKQTWHKKIEVRITSPSMLKINGQQDTVMLSSIFSYWN